MFLGRLRVAYKTFIESALHLATFNKVNIVAKNADYSEGVAAELSHSLPPMVSEHFEMLKPRQRKAYKTRLAQPCFAHAEVQLLMQLEHIRRGDSKAARLFNYIGCSKKTCYLCCKFIEGHKFFRTRGTHGKVCDQWSVSDSNELPLESVFKIKVTLVDMEKDMITRFEDSLCSPRKMLLVAESSVGNSVHSEASMYRHGLRQVGLESEGIHRQDRDERRKDPPATKLGKRRTSFRAARIPADSSSPIEIVRLITHETGEDYSCVDQTRNHVPNFAEFWGDIYNFDRTFMKFDAINHEPKSLNGDYGVFSNFNDELPENETVKGILGLIDVPSYRRFWYGDVFIERMREKNGSESDKHAYYLYDDIPPQFLESQLIALIFRRFWDSEDLEAQLEEDAQFQDLIQKMARDKDLVLQRMYVRNSHVRSSADFALSQDTNGTSSLKAHASRHS